VTFPPGGGIGFQNTGTVIANTVIIFGAKGKVLIYSGTPAFGNLIGSWAGQAGTDSFGNSYPAGLNVTEGAISGTTFSGTDFIINTNGFFFYSGTPALGNLVMAIAMNSGGTDAFGNVYPQGANWGVWSNTGVLEQHFGIDSSGDTFLANNAGKTVVRGQSSDGSMCYYSSAGLALGNLQIAIAPAAGTDSAGNSYVAGITIANGGQILTEGTGNQAIREWISAGNPIKQWQSGYVNESAIASITTNLLNIGFSNELIEWILHGPSVTGSTDSVGVVMQSAPNDASNDPFGTLRYTDTGNNNFARLVWDKNKVTVNNSNSGDTNNYDPGKKTLIATGQTINSTSSTIVTGLQGTVGIGKYHIYGQVTYKCNQAGGVPQFLIGGQAQSQILAFSQYLNLVNSGASTSPIPFINNTGYPNNAGPTMVNAAFLQYSFDITVTTTTSGGMSVEAATSIAADTFTIQAGSWMKIEPVF
jgi:hypothetical protein